MTIGPRFDDLKRRVKCQLDIKLLIAAVLLSGPAAGHATEYLYDEKAAPESADELETPFENAIEPEVEEVQTRWRILGRILRDKGPFWRDSRLSFNSRTYLFDRDFEDSMAAEALATGGELSFQSGLWKEVLRFATSWYGSFGIDAPVDKDGTQLLGAGQADLSLLGKLHVDLDFGGISARLYRQDLGIPYLNRQDSRMIPNIHEGYVVKREGAHLDFLIGHVTKMKKRNSEDYVAMSEVAGVSGSDNGATIVGALWEPSDLMDIGAMSLYTQDLFNTFYIETSWRRHIGEILSWQTALQYTDQRSVGRKLLGDFSTWNYGIRGAFGYRNAILKLSYSRTGDGAKIRSPYGGRPGFSSMMLLDFDFANQESFTASLSYNFNRIGIDGLSSQIKFAKGVDALTVSTGLPAPDQEELDMTIDYRPRSGPLAGIWARIRYGKTHTKNTSLDVRDFRVILNYEMSFQ